MSRLKWVAEIITNGKEPYATEEAEFLKSVLQDMEKLGLPPKRIYFIGLMIFEPDVIKKMAAAAYNTTIWRKRHKADHGEAVVKLLRLTDAYASFNEVLKPYGIELTVAHAEKICVTIKPEEIGLKKRKIKLPSCVTLEIYVHPIRPPEIKPLQ